MEKKINDVKNATTTAIIKEQKRIFNENPKIEGILLYITELERELALRER